MFLEFVKIGLMFISKIEKPLALIIIFAITGKDVLNFFISIKNTHKGILIQAITICLLCIEFYITYMIAICYYKSVYAYLVKFVVIMMILKLIDDNTKEHNAVEETIKSNE